MARGLTTIHNTVKNSSPELAELVDNGISRGKHRVTRTPEPAMFAFSFDLYDDAEFVANVCIHATDRVSAWSLLNEYTTARNTSYDAVQLVSSVVVA